MTPEAARQIGLLLLEAALVSSLLLLYFRARQRLGIAPLCVTLGAFQYLQTQLAASLYVEVWPGVFVSPGSTVLFTATLFTTLIVYIRDDAVQARSLIAGIVAANVTISVIALLANLHIDSALAVNTQEISSQYVSANAKTLILGTILLCADVLLIILCYESFYRVFQNSLFVRIALAMVVVVAFDTIVFVTLVFYGSEAYSELIVSGLIGKVAAALFYSAVAAFYLHRFPAFDVGKAPDELRDVFHILTYRQRYEMLKDGLNRDSMTGLFNRNFFNKTLESELERAQRLKHHLNVMLLDLDNFKSINDTYGHMTGDEIILLLAQSMKDVLREADIPCRYGGEEFVVIMPDSTSDGAKVVAQRLRRRFAELYSNAGLPVPQSTVTFTAGISSYPDEASTAEDLIHIADQRLYCGKRGGRDRVIASGADIKPASA